MLNPWYVSALQSLLRAGLMILATWLVEHGVFSAAEAQGYATQAAPVLAGVVVAGGTMAWGVYNSHHQRAKLVTATGLGRATTEDEITDLVKVGLGADVKTPTNVIPETGMSSLPVSERLL
jgi:hypothetical protein